MTIYFASDHHLYHNKIIEFSRPQFSSLEEHNEFIVDRHNYVVRTEDVVYFLGDVCLSTSKQEDYDILKRFNGKKRLVVGNHDTPERIKIYHQYFEKIYGYSTIGQKNGRDAAAIVSHIPVHPSQLEERFKFNIHGHLHQETIKLSDGTLDKRYVCVSLEQINYTPISLEEIYEKVKQND